MNIKLTCPRCGNELFDNGLTKPNYCGACEMHCQVTGIELVDDQGQPSEARQNFPNTPAPVLDELFLSGSAPR